MGEYDSFEDWYCNYFMPRYCIGLVAGCLIIGPISMALLLIYTVSH